MVFILQYLLIFLNLFPITILKQQGLKVQYVANTKYGLVQGVQYKNHFEFRKIPFVKPPLGHLRYRPPKEPEPWTGIFDSTKFSDFCIQYNLFWNRVEGVEDCLYLSVFTPKYLEKNESNHHNLPVMVNLHPGGFMFGRGSQFRADYIMESQQVVVVVPQYRVGSFGFLSTEDTQSWGNYGLKDQLKALIWVKENIHYFGGDAKSVTIFGTSAGGASVHYHILSKKSKGLFHRGISSSGCALNPWAFEPNPLKQARKLAQLLNCPIEKNKILIDCLRSKKADEIAGKHKDFVDFYKDPMTSFAPTIESSLEDSFISSSPIELVKNIQDINLDIPWIIGFTSDEGYEHSYGIIRDPILLSQLNENWSKIAPITLELVNRPEDVKKGLIERIYSHYFNSSPLTSASLDNLTIVYSDTTYIMPVIQCALKHSSISKSAVYLYDFNYESVNSFANLKDMSTKGASHMDDLQYLMNSPLFPELRKKSKDKEFGGRYLNMIIEFAKNGKIRKFDEKADIWEPLKQTDVDEKNFKIYRITSEPKMLYINLTNLYDRKTFWDIYNPEIEGERDEL